MQALALKAPGHVESALAVARAALDAQEFAVARNAHPAAAAASRRSASPTLMAEIEQRESGDEGRAREWMARALRAARDPEWSADGFVSDRWMPVSPVSGRLDAFQWKVPLAELGRRARRDRSRRSGSRQAAGHRGAAAGRRPELPAQGDAAAEPARSTAPPPCWRARRRSRRSSRRGSKR